MSYDPARCWRCHRLLRDPESRARGVGPVCAPQMTRTAWDALARARGAIQVQQLAMEGDMPKTYEFHEYADLFPMMDNEELRDLVLDIKSNGLQEPIVLYEGKILDGRNRYAACLQAAVDPRYVEYDGDDALGYVLSKNLHRRHLSSSQRAAIAAKALPMLEKAAKERQLQTLKQGDETPVVEIIPQRETGKAREKAAALTGTNPRYVQDAKRLETEAPWLLERVQAGQLVIPAAMLLLKYPEILLAYQAGEIEAAEAVGRAQEEADRARAAKEAEKLAKQAERTWPPPWLARHERAAETYPDQLIILRTHDCAAVMQASAWMLSRMLPSIARPAVINWKDGRHLNYTLRGYRLAMAALKKLPPETLVIELVEKDDPADFAQTWRQMQGMPIPDQLEALDEPALEADAARQFVEEHEALGLPTAEEWAAQRPAPGAASVRAGGKAFPAATPTAAPAPEPVAVPAAVTPRALAQMLAAMTDGLKRLADSDDDVERLVYGEVVKSLRYVSVSQLVQVLDGLAEASAWQGIRRRIAEAHDAAGRKKLAGRVVSELYAAQPRQVA